MAHFSRLKSVWGMFNLLTSAVMEQLDTNLTKAVNGDDGGTFAPVAQIIIGGAGLYVTGNLVANRLSGQVITGQTLTIDAGGTLAVYGALAVSGAGAVTFADTSTATWGAGTLAIFNSGSQLSMRGTSAATWDSGTSATWSSGAHATINSGAFLEMDGTQYIGAGALLDVLGTGAIQLESGAFFSALLGSSSLFAGLVALADGGTGGTNGLMRVGYPGLGVGNIAVYGAGSGIQIKDDAVLSINGTVSNSAQLAVGQYGFVTIALGGEFQLELGSLASLAGGIELEATGVFNFVSGSQMTGTPRFVGATMGVVNGSITMVNVTVSLDATSTLALASGSVLNNGATTNQSGALAQTGTRTRNGTGAIDLGRSALNMPNIDAEVITPTDTDIWYVATTMLADITTILNPPADTGRPQETKFYQNSSAQPFNCTLQSNGVAVARFNGGTSSGFGVATILWVPTKNMWLLDSRNDSGNVVPLV